MKDAIPEKSVVDYVPTFFGFGMFKRGVRPEDHAFRK